MSIPNIQYFPSQRKSASEKTDKWAKLQLKEDEVTLIELLNLNSFELVDILESHIFDQQDRLRNYYDEEADEDQES